MTSINGLGDNKDLLDVSTDDGELIEDTFTGRKLLL